MKLFKKIVLAAVAGTMVLSMAACSNNTVGDVSDKYDTMTFDDYAELTKDMDEAEFLDFVSTYSSSAKPSATLLKIVDTKKSILSEENLELVHQGEWASVIYNIEKYQSLIDVYGEALVFNDDGSFNYDETVAYIGDGIFEPIYQSMTDNGYKLMERNDEPYVTTDIMAFKDRIDGEVNDAFIMYLESINEVDKYDFIKDGIVNYDGLAHCMAFSDEFLKTQTYDKIWETVNNQFYYQVLMYTGLYGTGGFVNSDGTYNSDFEETVRGHIEEYKDTLFANIMQNIIDDIAAVRDSEDWGYDALQVHVDDKFNSVIDEYYKQFLSKVYPDEYAQLVGDSSDDTLEIITDENGNELTSDDTIVIDDGASGTEGSQSNDSANSEATE